MHSWCVKIFIPRRGCRGMNETHNSAKSTISLKVQFRGGVAVG